MSRWNQDETEGHQGQGKHLMSNLNHWLHPVMNSWEEIAEIRTYYYWPCKEWIGKVYFAMVLEARLLFYGHLRSFLKQAFLFGAEVRAN